LFLISAVPQDTARQDTARVDSLKQQVHHPVAPHIHQNQQKQYVLCDDRLDTIDFETKDMKIRLEQIKKKLTEYKKPE
jgi:hypothetical protein